MAGRRYISGETTYTKYAFMRCTVFLVGGLIRTGTFHSNGVGLVVLSSLYSVRVAHDASDGRALVLKTFAGFVNY